MTSTAVASPSDAVAPGESPCARVPLSTVRSGELTLLVSEGNAYALFPAVGLEEIRARGLAVMLRGVAAVPC